jgi:polar amino acid transport system substrate-binding protein
MKRFVLMALTLCLVLTCTTAFAGKIDDIKARGALVCGVKDSVVPFGYVDQASSQLVGFDVDICRAIAKELGVELQLKTVTSSTRIPMVVNGQIDIAAATMTHKHARDEVIDFSTRIPMVVNGQIDIAAATMTHKHARDEVIDFSITYFMDGQKLLVAKDSGIKSAADLAGKKVATVKGSTSEKNIKNAQPKARVLSFDEYPQAFLALKQGKAVAVTTDSTILLGLKNSAPDPSKWEIVGEYIAAEPYGLGIAENDSDFRDLINKTLNDLWRSGEYQKIYNKWFGKDSNYYLPLTWQMELWP